MRNLIWDLAVIVRDAFEAGRNDTADFENYNPPVKQFQRVESALQAINGTTVVVGPFDPELAKSMEAAWDHVNLPLIHEPVSPLKDFEKNGYAVQTLERLGYRWDGGRWIEPNNDAKRETAFVKLERLGFTFDPGARDDVWQPPRSCNFAGMLDALLQIRETVDDNELHGVLQVARLKRIVNDAVQGVGKVNSYREQLRKIREVVERMTGNTKPVPFVVLDEAFREIGILARD